MVLFHILRIESDPAAMSIALPITIFPSKCRYASAAARSTAKGTTETHNATAGAAAAPSQTEARSPGARIAAKNSKTTQAATIPATQAAAQVSSRHASGFTCAEG